MPIYALSNAEVHVELLKDCPQVIPTLAQWMYDDWHLYDAALTLEKMIASFESRLNNDAPPMTFVAFRSNRPIGVISLKYELSSEFSDLPKDNLWMGSLHVIPEERNQGYGALLLRCCAMAARQFGREELLFYTSNPANIAWYVKRGARILEERPFRGHRITLFSLPLPNNP